MRLTTGLPGGRTNWMRTTSRLMHFFALASLIAWSGSGMTSAAGGFTTVVGVGLGVGAGVGVGSESGRACGASVAVAGARHRAGAEVRRAGAVDAHVRVGQESTDAASATGATAPSAPTAITIAAPLRLRTHRF